MTESHTPTEADLRQYLDNIVFESEEVDRAFAKIRQDAAKEASRKLLKKPRMQTAHTVSTSPYEKFIETSLTANRIDWNWPQSLVVDDEGRPWMVTDEYTEPGASNQTVIEQWEERTSFQVLYSRIEGVTILVGGFPTFQEASDYIAKIAEVSDSSPYYIERVTSQRVEEVTYTPSFSAEG